MWLVACTAASNNDTASLTAASACDAYVTTVCNKLQECFPLALSSTYSDVAQCMDQTKLSCMSALGAQGTGATTAALDACTTAFKSATCDVLLGGTVPDACKTPAGTLADGKACGDLICDATRKCVEPGKQGDACSATKLCGRDVVCQKGTCDKPLALGATCNPAEPACDQARGHTCAART